MPVHRLGRRGKCPKACLKQGGWLAEAVRICLDVGSIPRSAHRHLSDMQHLNLRHQCRGHNMQSEQLCTRRAVSLAWPHAQGACCSSRRVDSNNGQATGGMTDVQTVTYYLL